MPINHVVFKNYGAIQEATIEFQGGLTIVVGDDEACHVSTST